MDVQKYTAKIFVFGREIIESVRSVDDLGAVIQAVSRTHVHAHTYFFDSGYKREGIAQLAELLDLDGKPIDIRLVGEKIFSDVLKQFHESFEKGIYTAREPPTNEDYEVIDNYSKYGAGAIFY